MNTLETARNSIDQIDAEMAKLFEKRLTQVAAIAAYKRTNGLPIFDQAREQQVINKNLKFIKNPQLKPYYIQFISDLMKLAKDYENNENRQK